MCLEKTVDLAGDSVNVDVEVAGSRGETRDCLDIGSKCVSYNVSKKNTNRVKKTYR